MSVLEAIELCQDVAGKELVWELSDEGRAGDHRWWISDLSEFTLDYPEFEITFGVQDVLREIYEANVDQWLAQTR